MNNEVKKKNQYRHLVTKGYLDLRLRATEQSTQEYIDLRFGEFHGEIREEMRGETAKILQAVDKVVTRFDKAEKDHAADKLLHDRHEKRIERVEAKLGIRGAI